MLASNRRSFLIQSFHLVGGILLARHLDAAASHAPGDHLVSATGFLGEGSPPMDQVLGVGYTGRRFTDLSNLPLDGSAPGNDQFFIRTRAPEASRSRHPWKIRIRGLTKTHFDMDLAGIAAMAKPQGFSVLECAGNDPGGRFGLLSAAEWTGTPIKAVMAQADRKASKSQLSRNLKSQILIKGIDDPKHETSGASWIFTKEQLISSGAFLAFRLNGEPLSPDNGGPVRLIIPGWYGCACIKWVTELAWVDDAEPASAHMRAYAERTHQLGTPTLAREYQPAAMQISAMPVRVEQWSKGGKSYYMVVGLLWGGGTHDIPLQIRVGEKDWEDVTFAAKRHASAGWSVWTYSWTPDRSGDYPIRLRPKDPTVQSIRLASDYYLRTCRIDKV